MPRAAVIEWGGERARLEVHDDPVTERREGLLTPLAGSPSVSGDFVRRCVDAAAARGCQSLATTAIPTTDAGVFLDCGFRMRSSLHLLVHDLRTIPETGAGAELVRARRRDRAPVLAIDDAAFETGWRLGEWGLYGAIAATPATRFRLAVGGGRTPWGYAITGRAGPRGYLQRLAVLPSQRGRGLGTALVVDGLRWCRRHRVRRVAVNTQVGNDSALALYRRLGFAESSTRLCVVELDGTPVPADQEHRR